MKRIKYHTDSDIYTPDQIMEVLNMSVNDGNLRGDTKGNKFYNIPCAFDIETTSFYCDVDGRQYDYKQMQAMRCVKLEKRAIMYVWQFGINGVTIVGRTWGQFTTMLNVVSDVLQLDTKKRLIIYVHNLSYEFQFIRKHFEWDKVFSIDIRKPIYAITKNGIEFRCSYLLTGYSLAKLSEQLLTYKCEKKSGDLDYSLVRHSETPLTPIELGYCVSDIRVVMNYIQERIEEYKGINNLPITKTGFVRKYCRKQCLRKRDADNKIVPNWDYIELMRDLQIQSLHEFNMLQRAFAGGFTHANADYTDEIIANVDSYDFTSSYPYVMVAEQYPMSRGVEIAVKSNEHFNFLISKYCCVFEVEFTDIFASQLQDNPISVSKCYVKENICENNGRLVMANKVAITITDVDFHVIKNFYTWKQMRVGNMICYKRGYLPTPFVKSILELYEKKTQLKGVEDKEVEYLNSKEMLNSCYGMCVTNPLRDEFTYNGEWDITKITPEMRQELLDRYNQSKNRFLFYPWGIYVTAYARRNLFTAIYQCKHDYIYSDTDSVKIMNGERHKYYFEAYNKIVVRNLKAACKHHNLPFSLCEPHTIKGVKKLLGVWDYEGRYKRFKTLGAKRYMVEADNALAVNGRRYDFSLTVSGVNKKSVIPYLVNKYGANGIFGAFSNYLQIPPEATGKNIHTYIDYEAAGMLTDYLGKECDYREQTAVHLEPTAYSLSLSVMYINYLKGIKFKD